MNVRRGEARIVDVVGSSDREQAGIRQGKPGRIFQILLANRLRQAGPTADRHASHGKVARGERLKTAAAALGESGLALQADLRRSADIDRLIETVRKRYGRLDILFANAGLGRAAPLEAVTEAQIDEQFAVNFKGLFFTVQKSVPLMEKGASIVLTTSFLNTVGTPGLSILSATKAAVRSLARTLGAELAPRGIRVNAVSPGPISTPFAGKLGLSDQDLKAMAETVEAQVPLQRFGESEEVARAALFLAGPDSSFVTGTELVVDGGLSQF